VFAENRLTNLYDMHSYSNSQQFVYNTETNSLQAES